MTTAAHPLKRPFAWRTYASAALWIAAVAAGARESAVESGAQIGLRLDLVGVLALASALIGGANFFGAGWRAVRRLRLDIAFLMSTAVLAAISIGEPFEAATLAFLFSVAELLEQLTVDRGRRAVARLLELAPEQAEVVAADGSTRSVPSAELKVGDTVRVRPGDKLSADGEIVRGASSVNEAAITGESLPRSKSVGDTVFAGTLNVEGSLDVRVTREPGDTTLARIVAAVRTAESQRAPIESLVQRFARVYTPIVSVLAVLVAVVPALLFNADFATWLARGITLLVVACPCALVIATPVTVVSALTGAARQGVLIKGGAHLAALATIRALAVDKTGTLTTGRLAVNGIDVRPEDQRTAAIAQIATLQAHSEHPIADAIVRHAREGSIADAGPVDSFEGVAGHGARARVNGVHWSVGSERFVGTAADGWSASAKDEIVVYAAADTGTHVRYRLRDEMRPEAPAVIAEMRQLGVKRVVMMTGDSAGVATEVGARAGVDEVRARLLPEHKVANIEALGRAHGAVAMLGDGVNDAPALAAATVGIAMGAAGSPAAIETADIALMGDGLEALPYAMRVAQRAERTIRFNVSVALGAKALLGVGAVIGTVSLGTAVLVGDVGASLLVTANAMRIAALRRRSRD